MVFGDSSVSFVPDLCGSTRSPIIHLIRRRVPTIVPSRVTAEANIAKYPRVTLKTVMVLCVYVVNRKLQRGSTQDVIKLSTA